MTTTPLAPATSPADPAGPRTDRGTLVVAGIALLIALAQIVLAAWICTVSWREWHDMTPREQRDAMIGPELGYFIAAVVAAPSTLALLLAGVGTAVRRRGTGRLGLALAVAGLATTALMAVFVVFTAFSLHSF